MVCFRLLLKLLDALIDSPHTLAEGLPFGGIGQSGSSLSVLSIHSHSTDDTIG